MKRKILLLILLALIIVGCKRSGYVVPRTVEFMENTGRLLSFGAEDGIIKAGSYESIVSYWVADNESVYINGNSLTIDLFDADGRYRSSLGGLRRALMEYPGWLESITVDSKGNVLVYSTVKRTFLLFSAEDGSFKTIPLGKALSNWYPKTIKFDGKDRLFILGYSDGHGYQLLRYRLDSGGIRIVHTDSKRIRPGFIDLLPDFTFDPEGRIYITDTINYKIYVIESDLKVRRYYAARSKKEKIKEEDFNLLAKGNRIRQFPDFQVYLDRLTGASGYFPAIFGLNIDGGRIFVWTCKQNEEKKYRVDVYDRQFNYLFSTFHYNTIVRNMAVIKERRLYLPNIGSSNEKLKDNLGRFSYFNRPYKIEVFQLPTELFKISRNLSEKRR